MNRNKTFSKSPVRMLCCAVEVKFVDLWSGGLENGLASVFPLPAGKREARLYGMDEKWWERGEEGQGHHYETPTPLTTKLVT